MYIFTLLLHIAINTPLTSSSDRVTSLWRHDESCVCVRTSSWFRQRFKTHLFVHEILLARELQDIRRPLLLCNVSVVDFACVRRCAGVCDRLSTAEVGCGFALQLATCEPTRLPACYDYFLDWALSNLKLVSNGCATKLIYKFWICWLIVQSFFRYHRML